MNKWIKTGIAGLFISTSAFAIQPEQMPMKKPHNSSISDSISIDVMDYAGGSKLRDRGFIHADQSHPTEMLAVLQA